MSGEKKSTCPRCESKNIHKEKGHRLRGELGLPSWYFCDDCFWHGGIVLETNQGNVAVSQRADHADTEEDMRRMDKGMREAHVAWKLFGPAIMLFGIALITVQEGLGLALFIIGGLMSWVAFFHKGE